MCQVTLGQPEVILWSIAFEADQEFWSLVLANQQVGENLFDLKLFLSIHQLWGWCFMRRPDLRWVGVVGFQVLHIWSGVSQASRGGISTLTVLGPLSSNTLRGPNHLGASFWLGSWRL